MPNDSLRHWMFDRFLPQNLNAQSPKTVYQYKVAFNDFAMFLSREPTLADLSDETLAAFAVWLHGPVREICARTTNERIGRLKTCWNWLAKKRIVDQFPTVGKLPEPQRLPRAWREDELVKIVNACRMERGHILDVPRWRWAVCLHAWWWNTGERTEATLLLPCSGIYLDEGVAVVDAGLRKGRVQSRVYHLWPDFVAMLRMILPPNTKPRERVFPWPFHLSSFYQWYDRMLRRARLPHDRYCKPQKMRVSRATWIKLNGGDPTEALGHASERTTRRFYLDRSLLKQDEEKGNLFRPW